MKWIFMEQAQGYVQMWIWLLLDTDCNLTLL